MALDVTIASIGSYVVVLILLVIFGFLDFRDRRVPNLIMLIGGAGGFVAVLLTGHLVNNQVLHISTLVFTFIVSLLLFRIGAIGGADVKALIIIAITSPGIAFASWTDPVVEGVVGSGLEIAIMLLLGLIYSRIGMQEESYDDKKPVPLLSLLLIAYILIQLLVIVEIFTF